MTAATDRFAWQPGDLVFHDGPAAAFHPDEARDKGGKWTSGGPSWAGATAGDLAAAEKSGVRDAEKLSGGLQASTQLVTYNDGSRWAHKDFHQDAPTAGGFRSTKDQADSEEAAGLVARAVGARIPPVFRTGRNSVATPFVPNTGTYGDHETDPASLPKDRLIGLTDGLTANNDRHAGNLLKTPDGPVGIDQSETWRRADGKWEIGSPLARALGPGDFTAAELDAIGTRLKALKPEFARIFGGTTQFDGTMRAWNHIKGQIGPASGAQAAFHPDEPRDERGRWGHGGGGALLGPSLRYETGAGKPSGAPAERDVGALAALSGHEARFLADSHVAVTIVAGDRVDKALAAHGLRLDLSGERGAHALAAYKEPYLMVASKHLAGLAPVHEVGHFMDENMGAMAGGGSFNWLSSRREWKALDARVLAATARPGVHFDPKIRNSKQSARERFAELYAQWKLGQPYTVAHSRAALPADVAADLAAYFTAHITEPLAAKYGAQAAVRAAASRAGGDDGCAAVRVADGGISYRPVTADPALEG